jgi:hypothetical protein
MMLIVEQKEEIMPFEIKTDDTYAYDYDLVGMLSVLSRNGYTLTITPIKYTDKNTLMIEIGEIDESFETR